jgi:hypothetical protein
MAMLVAELLHNILQNIVATGKYFAKQREKFKKIVKKMELACYVILWISKPSARSIPSIEQL